MKKALVVVAHGSRREASNDEVRALASRLADMPDTGYDSVTAAFLELAEPLMKEGLTVERRVEYGSRSREIVRLSEEHEIDLVLTDRESALRWLAEQG